jgi:hypothetical protein
LCTAGGSAQFKEPSHPLSQINPIDVPLNMSNEAILNISSLELNPGSNDGDYLNVSNNPIRNVSSLSLTDTENGFYIDNYRISDENGNHILLLDTEEDEFRIANASLDLAGNNLTEPNNINTGGESVTIRDSSNNIDILRANEMGQGGTVEIPNGNLDVFENRITGSEGRIGLSSSPDGVFLRADTGGVFLQRGGNDVLRAVGGGNIQIPDGNLNVSGENITNIDTLKFEEGTSIDGDLTINGSTDITGGLNVSGEINLSGDLDLRDNNLEDVRTITGGGDPVEFQDGIDLEENRVLNANTFRDNTGVDTIRFDGNNNVAIPNGNVSIRNRFQSQTAQSGTIRIPNEASLKARNNAETGDIGIASTNQDNDVILGSGGANELNLDSAVNLNGNDIKRVGGLEGAESGAIRLSNSESINFRSSEDDADFGITGTTKETIDLRNTESSDIARFKDNGDIEIPNGRLGIGRDPSTKLDLSLSNSGRIQITGFGSGAGKIRNTRGNLILNGSGVEIEDATGEVVRITNGRVGVGTANPERALEVASGDVKITNGDLRLNGNNVVSNVEDNMNLETQRTLVLNGDADSDGTGQVAIQTRGNNRVFVTNSGQVEIKDNDLDLQGNRIVDDTSSNTVYVGDGNNDNVRLETGGEDVDVPSGDVDVAGENVKNVNRVDFSNDEEIEEKNGDLCIGDRCA